MKLPPGQPEVWVIIVLDEAVTLILMNGNFLKQAVFLEYSLIFVIFFLYANFGICVMKQKRETLQFNVLFKISYIQFCFIKTSNLCETTKYWIRMISKKP